MSAALILSKNAWIVALIACASEDSSMAVIIDQGLYDKENGEKMMLLLH